MSIMRDAEGRKKSLQLRFADGKQHDFRIYKGHKSSGARISRRKSLSLRFDLIAAIHNQEWSTEL